MQYCKLQLGCMILLLYFAFIYNREAKHNFEKRRWGKYDGLLVFSIICVFFDGVTAYFVNNRHLISEGVNDILHMFFLISLDAFIFLLFLYMISITDMVSKSKYKRVLLWLPFAINVLVVVSNISSLEYIPGEISNYSMGISAYTCFIMAAVYIVMTIVIFFGRWHYIESSKRISIFTYLVVLAGVSVYQMCNPQALVTSIATVVIVIGIYMNHENPAIKMLAHFSNEMVMGFATLVENKDGSTGGHIKRTTVYVKLLTKELRRRGIYKNILTKDYMNNLIMAAPMHDIGKIAIPDAVLQKPGKLTDEEYTKMKEHTVCGGKIIKDTFGHLGSEQYKDTIYQVAMYHHEKWNGKGYPEGLRGKEIPLCARIMAIADVFDAISQKRCYRDAMPLEKCFKIIEEGRGTDFEPVLVDVFMDIRQDVEAACKRLAEED